MAAANMAHTPMVIIGPSAGSSTVGWDGFQECDTWNLFKPITKASLRVPHPSRAGDVLRTAFRIAYAERGPVFVDIPRDYLYGEVGEEISLRTSTGRWCRTEWRTRRKSSARLR